MAVTINGTTGIETNTDTGKVKVGASDDISIYHESGNSFIDNSTGDFKIRADNLRIRGKTADEMMISTYVNGTVALAYDGVQQCSTSANGLAFPSGKGIDFSATSDAGGMTSELLDTYEEGTFTPAIEDGGSNTQTFNATGRYTRIGRNVQVQFLLQFSGVGNSNHLKFNMPFTGLNNGALGGGVCIWSNLPGIDGHGSVVLAVQANTATIACHHGVDSDCSLGSNSYTNKAFYGVYQFEAA